MGSSPTREESSAIGEAEAGQRKTFKLFERFTQDMESGVAAAQICRVCTKTPTQRIVVNMKQMKALRAANNGALPPSAKCQPSDDRESRAIRMDRSVSKIAANRTGVPVKITSAKERHSKVSAWHESCGQSLQDKCRTCVHFKEHTVRVPATGRDGNTYSAYVVIGGYCKIPEAGIIVGGKTVFCNKELKVKESVAKEQSCFTCKWNTSYGKESMDYHVTPLLGDLTPYENFIARSAPEDEVAMRITNMRLGRVQVLAPITPFSTRMSPTWSGILKTYKLVIEKIYEDNNQNPVAVDLKIPNLGNSVRFELSEADTRIGLVSIADANHAILEILSPYHRFYGLPDNNLYFAPIAGEKQDCPTCKTTGNVLQETLPQERRRFGRLKKVMCERCGGTGHIREDIAPAVFEKIDYSARVVDTCTQCHGNVPCHYHLRKPKLIQSTEVLRLINGSVQNEYRQSVEYMANDTRIVRRVESPTNTLKLLRENKTVRVVDSAGNAPQFSLFRIRLRSILNWCKNSDERAQIMRQYGKILAGIPYGRKNKTGRVDLSPYYPAPVDPFHPFCSLNMFDKTYNMSVTRRAGEDARGLDFTAVWNDAFGTPRSDMSTNLITEQNQDNPRSAYGRTRRNEKYSWTKAQVHEEWLRVTNSGEILQDECLATLSHLEQAREMLGITETTSMPEATTTTSLGFGVPNTSIRFESAIEVMEWLDSSRIMPGNAEAHGFAASNRWFALGWENFRNTKKLQKDDIPSVFTFNHLVSMSDESTADAESLGFYVCTTCYDPSDLGGAGRYNPDEITTVDLSCPDPDCDGVLIFMSTDDEWKQGNMQYSDPFRRRSGSMDSPNWMQRERLQQMSCEFWAAK